MAFGAHPDDCDIKVGGIAIKYARIGHKVKFVSVTNGDSGHFRIGGGPLAQRRYKETQEAARIAGIEYEVFDVHDGQLMPTLENRHRIISTIRIFHPDLIFTHRPNDYHPDHRYTSQLVQDAAYTVTVPNVEALTPHLMYNPIIFYMSDEFQKPNPFSPDVVIGIDEVIEDKLRMLHCHKSQMYEWLPYNQGILDQVPEEHEERLKWLGEQRLPAFARIADKHRNRLKHLYGEQRGKKIRYAEAFEACEYGGRFTEDKIRTLFPFFS